MKKLIKILIVFLIITALAGLFLFFCMRENVLKNETGMVEVETGIYTHFYPNDTVKALTLYEKNSFLKRNKNPTTFEGENNGRDGSSVVYSPYFKVTINNNEIPVYSTLTYVGTSSSVQFHSFATAYVEKDGLTFDLNLTVKGFDVQEVVVLPKESNTLATINGKSVCAKFDSYGTYTFIFNANDQDHAFTLFVKPYADEDEEIENYKTIYGEDNVIVYEPGVYNFDYINIEGDNTVIYLRAGALLLPNHKYEMTKQEDDSSVKEDGAAENNSIGLSRFPVINCYNKKNVQIIGNGTIDMTQLDWHERRGVTFTNCENIKVKGINLINSADWSLITYCCKNVEIDDVTVFGYRTNSDAVVICNTKNATVKNCYARSGDDLFEVKTLGSADEWNSDNIIFENCNAWNGKTRCFGIIHEVNKPISNVTFKNCNVLYRDATWDNDFVSSLTVEIGQGGAKVENILFEDINIYKDTGRPINVLVYGDEITGSIIKNVAFKNVSWNSDMKAQIKAENGNEASVVFENVIANEEKCDNTNALNWLENNGANFMVN